jgi:transposase
MSRTFKTVDYDQALDLTVRLGDCLPPEHLARFVVDSVAQLDLSALYAHYRTRGGEPYAPEVLLGLVLYGYATGVSSSRKIERATYEAVPFRFIAGNLHPDHDTLVSFRRTFLSELKELFVQVLLLAQEAGVLKLGTISLDGTKIHADASKHNAVIHTPRLGKLLDFTCLAIFEGQYLDMSFEHCLDISVSMYLNMIHRKTAALMACAVEMGGHLGTRDAETIRSLRSFGWKLGTAFQVRDDLLGIWDTKELGKSPAGDLYRRKKTMPVIHALEHANAHDQQLLRTIYEQKTPVTPEQVEDILAILARTHSRAYCQEFLTQQCEEAHAALSNVPRRSNPLSERAFNDMQTIVNFLEEAAH